MQLTPFLNIGTSWNNQSSDPDPTTIASVGLGLNWLIDSGLIFSLDYGIPLIYFNKQNNSLQENGLSLALRYQLF